MIEVSDHNFWGIALASISANLILGHNLWLVVKDQRAERGKRDTRVRVEVNTSDNFPASESAVRPERIADFRVISAGAASVPITEYVIEGQSLVAIIESPCGEGTESTREGPCLVALELHPHPIVLEAEKFAHYIRDEDAAAQVAPHFEEGKTVSSQRESYTKYAKAWLGSGTGDDDAFRLVAGHRLEIVPLLSPASARRDGKRLPVQVLFDGEPMADLRVSSGCENLGGGKYAAHTRTDEEGRAWVEMSAPGRWFIRAHHIRPHRDSRTADWESFWASLTFQIHQ